MPGGDIFIVTPVKEIVFSSTFGQHQSKQTHGLQALVCGLGLIGTNHCRLASVMILTQHVMTDL